MLDSVAAVLGLKYGSLIGGFIGALVSLKFIEGLGMWQRGTTVLAGTLSSAYVTPIVVEWLDLSPKLEGGIAFLIGLFGMSLAGAIVQSIPAIVDAAKKRWIG